MASALRTPLCIRLGIDYPIFSVGFGISAGPELAGAVCRAGGCGVLGGGLPPDEIRRRIARMRELTDRPFGLNIIIAELEHPAFSSEERAFVESQIEAAIEARVPLLVLFWGDPSPFVEPAHRNGVELFVQVGSVEEAEAAAAAGVDGVIAQGIEAGGHVRATASIWEVLPAVVERVGPLPVLASGGMRDGAAIAKALRLGAQGVSLGTRFVASEEAFIHPVHKRRVVESGADDTYYGVLFDVWWPDAPHRVLRNATYDEWDAAGRPQSGARPGEGTVIGEQSRPWGRVQLLRYASAMLTPDFEGDHEYAPLWAGESCEAVRDVQPAAEIVRGLVAETEAALAAAAG